MTSRAGAASSTAIAVGVAGLAEAEALHFIALVLLQEAHLFGGLHALGDHLQFAGCAPSRSPRA